MSDDLDVRLETIPAGIGVGVDVWERTGRIIHVSDVMMSTYQRVLAEVRSGPPIYKGWENEVVDDSVFIIFLLLVGNIALFWWSGLSWWAVIPILTVFTTFPAALFTLDWVQRRLIRKQRQLDEQHDSKHLRVKDALLGNAYDVPQRVWPTIRVIDGRACIFIPYQDNND